VKYIPNVAMCARCSQGLVRMAVTYATPETGEFIVQSYAHSQLDAVADDIDEPRAVAAALQRARGAGLCHPTDRYRPSERPICHARPVRIWKGRD
jgi:hypothetical protein